MARKALILSGVGFSGVDIMHSPKGSLILEVNRRPGLEGYIEYVDADIMQKLVAEIVENRRNTLDRKIKTCPDMLCTYASRGVRDSMYHTLKTSVFRHALTLQSNQF